MNPASISIVIPAYNEAAFLPATLDAIGSAIEPYQKHFSIPVEVIVVDNGSTDATASIAQARGAKVVREDVRQIARARNRGASAASGDFFLFCDADTRIHPETLLEIARLAQDERIIAGGIPLLPEQATRGALFSLSVWNLISRTLNISGGTLFCRKDVFQTLGGFPERFFIGEEVALQYRLKLYAWRHGKKIRLLSRCGAVTSMRKIRDHGVWGYGWAVLRCAIFPWLATQKKHCALWYDVRTK